MSDDSRLVTFALFAYNQERFIAEAVRGALSQTYSPLEIIISDDCSTDHTFKIIQEQVAEYSGPHEVRLNRNERNIGFGSHVNRVMGIARGALVVAGAGDDVSLPHRVEKLYSAYNASGRKVMSVFSNAIVIDEFGNREGFYLRPVDAKYLSLQYLAEHMTGALGCAHAWDRRVFDLLGPMDEEVIHEDVVIAFRSALLGKVEFINEALVLYRRHGSNIHFAEPDDVKGPDVLYALLQKSADNKIAIYRSRLQDLNLARQLYPDRQVEFSELERITLRMLREMKDEKSLLQRPNFSRRIGIMGRALWHGTPPRRVIRWVLTFFFPRLYLIYLTRLRVRVREANRI
ncbi:MAG TPA: glycosyltransferase [Blastocatellia bacterium]|jgi:glycosyltransferase involved in cell wall biosynthesis